MERLFPRISEIIFVMSDYVNFLFFEEGWLKKIGMKPQIYFITRILSPHGPLEIIPGVEQIIAC